MLDVTEWLFRHEEFASQALAKPAKPLGQRLRRVKIGDSTLKVRGSVGTRPQAISRPQVCSAAQCIC